MLAIIKKDFKTMFSSPIGYVIVAIFLLICNGITYLLSIANRNVQLSSVYYGMALYGLPIITALLTMRTFSEERNKDTEKLLLVSNRNMFSIIFGKIISVFLVILICVGMSLFDMMLLMQFGTPDWGTTFLAIIGFIFLSLAYISFGVLISSLTEHQIISAIITVVFLMLPIFINYGDGVFSYLSVVDFYSKFPLGIISIKEIIGLISFTLTCSVLTFVELKRRKNLE